MGSQLWDGEQTLGYSHNCRLGAVVGCHVEALGLPEAFLCVLEAAFHGGKVGCGGKGDAVSGITIASLHLEHSMEALEHLSSSHGILWQGVVTLHTASTGLGRGQSWGRGQPGTWHPTAQIAAAPRAHSKVGVLSLGMRFWGFPRQGHNLFWKAPNSCVFSLPPTLCSSS